jgi:capsular exopolysaccharide synthesis family protein
MLQNTPSEEKELKDRHRIENIKEELFLDLLKKKEEAAISKASVTPDTKLISPPIKSLSQSKPSNSQITIIFIMVGLLIPIAFGFAKEMLNNKIISQKQLQSISSIPILAELEKTENNKENPFVIDLDKRSMFGEQVRSLRTNLNFYNTQSDKANFILITSSMSGEGKSFISMNLARSYSLQGKKVALLEFDLRRPKISALLSIPTDNKGISDILLGRCKPDEIIYNPLKEKLDENLHFFPAGPIPPNPQELLSNMYLNELKNYLDKNYDVAIIDTPPYGIVSDAQILANWADISLFITRFNYTIKEQIQEINEWQQKAIFKRMAFILNAVKNTGYFGHKYGYYYYKKKYGYYYYNKTKS